jgi:outer membrane lipoprotein SlyB
VVETKGAGSGLGAIGGAVVGGLLGNQVGGGSGRTAATVAGAVGGAVAGHQIEKHVKVNKRYDVSVRMDNGGLQTFPFDGAPAFAVGEKIRVIDGKLIKG